MPPVASFFPTSEQKYIYIVFTVTNTFMGACIRTLTRNRFNHVSISLDDSLSRMYSFARYRVNSPFAGGFICENPNRCLHNGEITVKVCRIPVSENEYNRIVRTVEYFIRNQKIMLYNSVDALSTLIRKKIKIKNAYTCIDFVCSICGYEHIRTIKELENYCSDFVFYNGPYSDYRRKHASKSGRSLAQMKDLFFERRDPVHIVTDTVSHFAKIVARI